MTSAEVDSRLLAVSRQLTRDHPPAGDRVAALVPIWRSPWGAQGGTGPGLLMFGGFALLLLLIAVANAAHLLLSHAVVRQREFAVRIALGARPSAIILQSLTESSAVAGVAAACGLFLANLFSDAVIAFLPATDSPFVFGRPVGVAVLSFTVATTVTVVLLFGSWPAFQMARTRVLPTLGNTAPSEGGKALRFRKLLIAFQVMLSVMFLATGGLFIRSLAKAQKVPLGFDASDITLATVDLAQAGYDDDRGRLLFQELIDSIDAATNDVDIAVADRVPLGFTPLPTMAIDVAGYVPAPGERVNVAVNTVSAHYFRTLRMPLLAGREFTRTDTPESELIAIINETVKHRYLGATRHSGRRRPGSAQWWSLKRCDLDWWASPQVRCLLPA